MITGRHAFGLRLREAFGGSAVLLFITLIVILPLLVVVLPVIAYAAYVDLLENS